MRRATFSRQAVVVLGAVALTLGIAVAGVPAAGAETGQVLSTGTDALGQQGSPDTTGRTTPGSVSIADPVAVASGRDHAYTLDARGRVWAWGSNEFGQIGDGTTIDRPEPVMLDLTDVVAVEAGHYHGLAIRSNGTVWTWGYGWRGQLGNSQRGNKTRPGQISNLSGVVAVAAGRDMSYAITETGQLYAWGNNAYGEVGDGTTTQRLAPVLIGGMTDVRDISGGRNHALAVTNAGQLWAWGDNRYGQIGDGTTLMRTRPVAIPVGIVRHADAGAHHSLAVTQSGTVQTWGRGYRGQLGHGDTGNRTEPTTVAGLTGITDVGDGRDQSFAITDAGEVYAWGNNSVGQLGDGTTALRNRPVLLALSSVKAAQGGSAHTIFFTSDGQPAPNEPPVAAFTTSCAGTTCSFDGTSSRDPDGTVVTWNWTFGDTSSASRSTVSHTFTQPGDYVVTLSVTDDEGAAGTTTGTVIVRDDPPPADDPTFLGASGNTGNTFSLTAAAPAPASAGDTLVLFVTANRSDVDPLLSEPGWQALDTIVDQSMITRIWTKRAGGADEQATVVVGERSKLDVQMLAYGGTDVDAPVAAVATRAEPSTTAVHTTPAISPAAGLVVSYWADKTSSTTGWSLPDGVVERRQSLGAGGGRITSLVADSGSGVPERSVGGLSAVASSANGKATMVTLVLRPR